MQKIKKIIFTIGMTALAFVVNYAINFFLTPYITQNVGTEAYGYVSLAKTFASYANIITIALNGYASRFIAIEYHMKKYKDANIYFSSVLLADIVLAIVIFFISLLFTLNIQSFFIVSETILTDVKLLFVLVFLNLALTLSTTVLQAAAYISNKLDIVSISRGASYIVEAMLLLLCYTFFPPRVAYVGVGIIVSSFVIIICNWMITLKYTPEIRFYFQYFSLHAVKKLVAEGIWNSVNSLGNLLNTGLDLIITNILLSPLAMGYISIVKSVTTIFSNIYQMSSTPFQPIFLEDYAKNNAEKLLKNIKFSMKFCGLISNVAFSGFVSLGRLYFKLWLPNQNSDLLYNLAIIALLSGIAEGAMYPLYYIYTLTVKNKIPSIITILGGVLNVLGMFLLIRYTDLGIYAVQWTTTVIMLSINFITNPIYMAHCLKTRWFEFYPTLFRHVLACGILTMTLSALTRIMNPTSWEKLIICAIVEVFVGSIIHFKIVFNKSEKKQLFELITRYKIH